MMRMRLPQQGQACSGAFGSSDFVWAALMASIGMSGTASSARIRAMLLARVGLELADRHVFDHAPTQRADGLLGHGDAPVLSERLLSLHLQDRTPRRAIVESVPLPQCPTARAV